MKKFLLSLLVSVVSLSAMAGWVKTDLASIKATDIVVIVDQKGNYAMSNNNGTDKAPAGVVLTIANNKITSEVADNLKWNIVADGSNYTIYPNGTTETWLYCTNTNNGVRVGTNENKVFTFESTHLKNTATSRYLGVYTTNPDWRCYTSSTTNNIKDTNTAFYVYTEGDDSGEGGGEVVETVATPVISPASGEITADTEISIECATEDATIKYTIDGTEPSAENGTIYTAPFTLNVDATVKAIAIKDGYNNSIVASATYTLFVSSEYSYQLATSVENGGHYIIVGADGENYFAMGTQNSNNRAAIAVSVTDGIIANPTVRVCEFELQGSEGSWSFYTGDGYLYAASSSKNYLKTETTISDNSSATIVIDETTGVATIKFTGANTRNWMRYNPNNGSPLFSCYASGQNDVYLYQRVGDIPTGIEDTMVDENAPVEYYNLQGVKVANPENGIFIKKQGNKTTKVVL